MGRAIGIDLGTTNSCAAVMEASGPRVLTYQSGERTIPSVFALDKDGNSLVGNEARDRAQLEPEQTVVAAKRLIGRNFHSKSIDRIKQVFTYEMLEGERDDIVVRVQDRVFTLEQIGSAILRKIKTVAEETLGEDVDDAVITVPAYFNDRQRQAVRNAGRMAGLNVLRILNEPTAAALAYGLGRGLSQRIAVYDLGGGTFDVSVIDIEDRVFEVIATGGDTFLGGVDFDDRLMRSVIDQFVEAHNIDLALDRVAVQRIRDAVEQAKIDLSTLSQTRIHIPFIARGPNGPLDIDWELTRTQLEELTTELVERTLTTCEQILRDAKTTTHQIDAVLLVGGQSRMPLVQRRLEEFMGRTPSKGVHPDEAVAIGAAIMADSMASADDGVTLLDVLPMPIGIRKLDGTMHNLFHRNQALPDYKTRKLTTSKDNQRSIKLKMYQGESHLVAENELLGTFVFSGLRQAPRGEVELEVTFHIDAEGILNLSGKDLLTGNSVESRLKLRRKKKRTPSAATAASTEDKTTEVAPEAPASPLTMPTPSFMNPSALAEERAPDSGNFSGGIQFDAPEEPAESSTVPAPDTAAGAATTTTGQWPPPPPPSTSRAPRPTVAARIGGWLKRLFTA